MTSNSSLCPRPVAISLVRFLVGSCRKGEAYDPEVYLAAITAVLCSYPEEVARSAVNPVSGLPSRLSFLPTVAEVKAACEEEMRPFRRKMRDEQIAAQTRALTAPTSDATAEERARVVSYWEQVVRPTMGVEPKPKREPESLSAVVERVRGQLESVVLSPEMSRKFNEIRNQPAAPEARNDTQ